MPHVTKDTLTGLLILPIIIIFIVVLQGGNAYDSEISKQSYDIIYQWRELDFAFESDEEREEAILSERFIPKSNVISDIKRHGDKIFLTLHRWRPGVPATLVSLPYDKSTEDVSGEPLNPYPSWDMNEQGNCKALQYANFIEIDQYGRMWVPDVGRTDLGWDHPDNSCPPKLVLIDLESDEVIHTYEFPDDVVSRNSSILDGIAVACTSEENCWAYITDKGDDRLVVYSFSRNRAWFVQHESMKPDENATLIEMHGKTNHLNVTVSVGINGIALSPLDTGFSELFYSPLSSYHLYKVNTYLLQRLVTTAHGPGVHLSCFQVTDLGLKPAHSDAMVTDANGILYYGQLELNAVYKWDTSESVLTDKNQDKILHDNVDLQWASGFAIDKERDLFVVTNRWHKFIAHSYDFSEINFRILRTHIGAKNYMHPEVGKPDKACR